MESTQQLPSQPAPPPSLLRFPTDVGRLLGRLRQRWRLLALVSFLGGVAGAALSLVLPTWYESQAVLAVIPVEDPSTPGPGNAIEHAGAELPMLSTVLHSRRVADATIEKLHLVEAFGVRTADDARAELARRLTVGVDRKSDLVSLRVEDRRPERAQAIVLALVDEANQVQAALWTARLREHRRRLEQRRAEVARELSAAESALRTFKERHHVAALDEQIKATVDAAAALDKIRAEKELGLEFARGFAGPGSPEVQRARREVAVTTRAMRTLGKSGGPSLPLDQLPALEAEHAQLKRAADLGAARYELLDKQVEQLTAVESRPIGRADVVDPPVVPRRHVRPARTMVACEGALLALLLAAAWVLVRRPRPQLH